MSWEDKFKSRQNNFLYKIDNSIKNFNSMFQSLTFMKSIKF